MSFTGITVLSLLEMRAWVFSLLPHLTAEKKIAPSARTTLVPETSRGTSDSLCFTACSVFFPSWTREQSHVSTALWFKEEQVRSLKQVDVCFIPIIYHLMMKTEVLFTEHPLSYVACNGIIHSSRCFTTTLLSVTCPFLTWKSHRCMILSYGWQTNHRNTMDKTGVPTNFVQRHLKFKSTTKLHNSFPHIQRTATTSWKGKNEQLPQIFSGSHKDKNSVLEISLQLPTTHIKSLLLIPQFPAYATPSCKLHNT